MRIPATLFFGQTFGPYILLFTEIWQGSGGHVVFQNRPKINTKQAILGCIKVQLHTYGSHLNQRKKNPWQNTLKKPWQPSC